MKALLKITLLIAFISFFASCESGTDSKQILSKSDTRRDMMDKIAKDSTMAKEMMTAMMTSNSGMAMMQDHQMKMMQNHETMVKMMKDNPGIMESMLTSMMEACKGDSSMMSGMYKMMMGNRDMMDKIKGKKRI